MKINEFYDIIAVIINIIGNEVEGTILMIHWESG
jgi:hypothetical protein